MWRRCPAGNGLGAIAVVASGGVLAQAVNVAAMVALTRLRPLPEDYASWAVLDSRLDDDGWGGVEPSLRGCRRDHSGACGRGRRALDLVFCRSRWPEWGRSRCQSDRRGLASPAPGISCTSGGTAGLALVASTGVYQGCYAWCTREGWFRLMAASSIAQVVLTAIAQIWFGLSGSAGTSGLVSGSVAGTRGRDGTLRGSRPDAHPRRPSPERESRSPGSVIGRRRVPPVSDLHGSVFACSQPQGASCARAVQLDGARSSQVGLYAFSNRLVSIPLGLTGNAIRPIVFRRASVGDVRAVERLVMDVLHLLEKCTVPFVLLFLWQSLGHLSGCLRDCEMEQRLYIYAVVLVLARVPAASHQRIGSTAGCRRKTEARALAGDGKLLP